MREPKVVRVNPPNTCPIYVPIEELDVGEIFIANPVSTPTLRVIVEKPDSGLLQVLDLEEGCIQPMSRKILIRRVTTVITVFGDVVSK